MNPRCPRCGAANTDYVDDHGTMTKYFSCLVCSHRWVEDNSKPLPEEETLYAEPLVGWRVWASKEGVLQTGSPLVVWEPRKPTRAVHQDRGTGSVFNKPPLLPCADAPCDRYDPTRGYGCGIYGFKTPASLQAYVSMSRPELFVVGQVYLWGRIFEHEHGYRAQYAYPKKFIYYHDARLLRDLGQKYNVPVEEDPTWKSAFRSEESYPSPYLSPNPSGYQPMPLPPVYLPPNPVPPSKSLLRPAVKVNPSRSDDDVLLRSLHRNLEELWEAYKKGVWKP